MALVSLVATVAVGVVLRFWLAGVGVPGLEFGHVRHLHTHLGTYGVLFPLMWAAWCRSGVAAPSTRTMLIYAGATAASAWGFATAGYGPVAIAGSTAVLGVWLHSAWRIRARAARPRGWLATVPMAIALGAALIPLVAVHADTDRAPPIVRSFLGLLFLGALVPTALLRLAARRVPELPWFVALTCGGLALGAIQSAPMVTGLFVLGVAVGIASWTSQAPRDVRAGWIAFAAGLAGTGLGLVPLSGPVAVAGTHFLILGPLLLTLWPTPIPAWVRGPLLAAAAAMALVILAQGQIAIPHLPMVTAGLGATLALGWTVLAVGTALQVWRRNVP